jgi:hypothetical protein
MNAVAALCRPPIPFSMMGKSANDDQPTADIGLPSLRRQAFHAGDPAAGDAIHG